MTRSELTNLFIRKTELFNSEQLLFSLKESYSVAIESGFSENLERNIFELEQKITREKAAIEQDRETALQTLKLIEDDAGRVGAMLHYSNDTAPYFAGEMISTRKLPTVKREILCPKEIPCQKHHAWRRIFR